MEDIVKNVLDEYGSFLAFLVINNLVLGYAIKVLWKRNEYLGNKLIGLMEKSIEVETKLLERVK